MAKIVRYGVDALPGAVTAAAVSIQRCKLAARRAEVAELRFRDSSRKFLGLSMRDQRADPALEVKCDLIVHIAFDAVSGQAQSATYTVNAWLARH
jgi:hypothetical protein